MVKSSRIRPRRDALCFQLVFGRLSSNPSKTPKPIQKCAKPFASFRSPLPDAILLILNLPVHLSPLEKVQDPLRESGSHIYLEFDEGEEAKKRVFRFATARVCNCEQSLGGRRFSVYFWAVLPEIGLSRFGISWAFRLSGKLTNGRSSTHIQRLPYSRRVCAFVLRSYKSPNRGISIASSSVVGCIQFRFCWN